MRYRSTIAAFALVTALGAAAHAQAPDESKYPEWQGQWQRPGPSGEWDQTKPPGRGQQAPLIPEYQAIFEAAQADMRSGGRGITPSMTCIPPGLPRAMIVYESMEIVVKPYTTYIHFEFMDPLRRIYTDGRDWPKKIEPTFLGYSIGHWEDTDGDGVYDTLVAETRGFKGPRIVDGSGIPLHKDNQTIIKERLYLDKDDMLRDQVTIVDNALTGPWTVTRRYVRSKNPRWYEYNCTEDNQHVFVGKEAYILSSDGYLMPTRKGQPPPDLRFFDQPQK